MASILTLIQDFCSAKGLASPSGFIGNTDKTYTQLLALCHRVVEDAVLSPWQPQVKRVTFTSVAAEVQGAISTLFGAGYRTLRNGTLWDADTLLPIYGPVGDQEWNALVTLDVGPSYQYRIMGNNLHILPVMPAGHTISAIVATNYGIVDAIGNAKERFTVDTDIPLFPDNFFKLDLEWRWLEEQGQRFASKRQDAYWLKAALVNKDAHLPTFHLDRSQQAAIPGVVVPAGSWTL